MRWIATSLISVVLAGGVAACGSTEPEAARSTAAPRAAEASRPAPATVAEQRRYERQMAAVAVRLQRLNLRAARRNAGDSAAASERLYSAYLRNFRRAALDLSRVDVPEEVRTEHEAITKFFFAASRSLMLQAARDAAANRDPAAAKEAARLPLVDHPTMAAMRRARRSLDEKGYRVVDQWNDIMRGKGSSRDEDDADGGNPTVTTQDA